MVKILAKPWEEEMSSAQKMNNPKAKELAESNVAKLWEEALHKAAKTEDTASSSSSSM